nr:MAG TPA: hypothetical protein [Caudoviricetes sp.]DAR42317.1 MAG TPA: hypothetical protein [Caudoviricetes sp.]
MLNTLEVHWFQRISKLCTIYGISDKCLPMLSVAYQ